MYNLSKLGRWSRTGTVGNAKGYHLSGIAGTGARLIRAVADTVAEVDVLAQAGSISGTTAERRGLAEHVANASSLWRKSVFAANMTCSVETTR